MSKSLPMLPESAATDLADGDLLYTVRGAGGADRDRKITALALFQGLLSGQISLGDIEWVRGQPSTYVPAWRTSYPGGELQQGWLNLVDLFAETQATAVNWDLSDDLDYDVSDAKSGVLVRATGTPEHTSTLAITGTLRPGCDLLVFVGEATLPIACLVTVGTLSATIHGGELVRVHWAVGGSPMVEVIGAPEITLQSAKTWGGSDTRVLSLQDDTINSIFDIVKGGALFEGVAGIQLPRRSTALLEAVAGVSYPVRSHFLAHEHGGVFERIPVLHDSVSPWWLRVDRQRCRLQDKADARAGAGSLTTAWKDLTVSEAHFPEFSSDSDALSPPGIPTELTVYLTLLATGGGGSEGFETTRDNLEFQFVWAQAGAPENLVWPGEILSSTRFGLGGSNSTWVLRFHGIQAGVLHVPQYPVVTGPNLDCWAGNFLPGGGIQARVKSGTATHSVVGGAWIDFNLRERLPKDYGYRESI